MLIRSVISLLIRNIRKPEHPLKILEAAKTFVASHFMGDELLVIAPIESDSKSRQRRYSFPATFDYSD